MAFSLGDFFTLKGSSRRPAGAGKPSSRSRRGPPAAGPGKRRSAFAFESVEPRVLLSVDLLPVAAAGLEDGLSLLGDRVEVFLRDDATLGDRVPILLKAGKDADGDPVFESPTVLDLLSVPVDADGNSVIDKEYVDGTFILYTADDDEAELQTLDNQGNGNGFVDPGEFLQGWFFDRVEVYLATQPAGATTEDLVDYLKGDLFFGLDRKLEDLTDLYEVDFEVIDAKVLDTTEDPDAEFTFSVGFRLTITQTMPIDLGLEADALRILPFTGTADDPDTPRVPVSSTLDFAFDFGIYTGGQADADIDSGDFFVRKAEPIAVSVKAQQADMPDFNLNVGFLGAKVVDGSLNLQVDVQTRLLDPNDPAVLGFTDDQRGDEETDGSVTAANALADIAKDHSAGFVLRIGNLGIAKTVDVIDLQPGAVNTPAEVIADIDTALVAAGLGDLVEVSLDAGKVKFQLVATSDTPLNFANESNAASPVTSQLLATPDGDGGNIFEYTGDQTLLLSVGGALPKLVRVNFPDPSDTDIGLNNGQEASVQPLLAPNAAAPVILTGDAGFTVTVWLSDGSQSVHTFTLTAADTAGNLTAGDLAADIDLQLTGSPVDLLVQASAASGHIQFSATSPLVSAIRVQASGMAIDEVGFAADNIVGLQLLAADAAVPNLTEAAIFKLTLDDAGTLSTTTVTVPDFNRASLGELAADINDAIEAALGSNRIDAFVSGSQILLAGIDTGVRSFSVKTINENLDDLVLDVNRALATAGLSAQVTASATGLGQLQLASNGGESLEITRTLTFDAGVAFGELRYQVSGGTATADLFSAAEGTDSKVQMKLPVTVLPGLEDATTGADDDWQPEKVALVANFNPFNSPAAEYDAKARRFDLNFTFTPGAGVPDQDGPAIDVPAIGDVNNQVRLVNFGELLNFNIVSAESIIGLLGSLGTALQQLSDGTKFSSFDIPFADATLSDLLNFTDDNKTRYSGLIDMLMFDTAGDGIDGDGPVADKNGLLKKVTFEGTSYLLPAFSTAQTLATRLDELLEAPLAGAGGINATYDKVTNELTYQVDLRASDRTAVDKEVDFEHDVALDPFSKLTVDSAVPPMETRVELRGRTGLDMTFGVDLSPPGFVILPSTKLSELNAGSGVDILRVKAVTGTKDLPVGLEPTLANQNPPPVYQLSADATFSVKFDGDATSTLVTVKRANVNNHSMGDFAADVNNALVLAGIADKLVADFDGRRLVLAGTSPAVDFKIMAGNQVTISEIGFDVSVTPVEADLADFVVVDRQGNRHRVVLDGLTGDSTVQQLLDLLDGVANTKFSADFNALQTGLRLEDISGGSGKFSVESVNGSGALLGLGLFLAGDGSFDPTDPYTGPNTFQDGDPNLIEGGGIGLTRLDQRFFVRDAQIRIDGLEVKTPDAGVPGEGLYGIVGVDAVVDGRLWANVTAQLADPGGPKSQITLAELLGRSVELPYDAQAAGAEFTVGGVLQGSSPGDSATIIGIKADSGAADSTGTLILANVKGAFSDGEALSQKVSDTLTATASVDNGSTVTLADPVVHKVVKLKYEAQQAGIPFVEFKVGGLLVGSTLGDTAVIVGINDDTSPADETGTLLLANVRGAFTDGEAIAQKVSDTTFASATADDGSTDALAYGAFELGITVQPGFDDPAFDTTDFGALDGASYTLPFDLTGFGSPFTNTPSATSALNLAALGELQPFDKLTYADLAGVLHDLLNLLGDVQTSFVELTTPLPAINRSVADLLSLVTGFERAVADADARFGAAIEAIGPKGLGLPALRLQEMGRALRGAFGLPDNIDPYAADAVDWVRLDYDPTEDELLLSLQLHEDVSTKLGLDIDPGAGLPHLTSAGVLEVSGTLDTRLDVAIDLSDPSKTYLLDSSRIDGMLHVQGEGQEYVTGDDGLGLVFRSSVGPLAVFVQDGDALIDFEFALPGLDFGIGVTRKALSSVVYDDFKTPDITKDDVDIVLPMFFDGEGPDNFIGEFKADGTILANSVTPPDFSVIAGQITAGTLPFDPFDNILLAIDTLDLYLESLSDQLSADVLGIQLPFIGDQMADVLFIEDFRSTLVRALKNGIENAVNPTPDLVTDILEGLFVGGALNGYLIGDVDDTDRLLTGPVDSRYREWKFTIGQTGSNADVITIDDFDIGPDHMGFDIKAPVTVKMDWSIEIAFGVDFGNGAYIEVSDGDEIDLDLTITMPTAMASIAYLGELGYLRLDVKDTGPASGAVVDFVVNVDGDSSGGRLGFADLGSLNPLAKVSGDGLNATDPAATFALASRTSKGMPDLKANLVFDWQLAQTDVDSLVGADAVTPGIQLIALNGMELDAISGVRKLLGPAFDTIAQYIEPFMPVVDALTAPIPILSDIAGEPFTLLDLAAIFGDVDPRFIEAVADILDVIEAVGEFTDADKWVLPLGDLVLFNPSAGVTNFDPGDITSRLDDIDVILSGPGATPGLVHNVGGVFDTAVNGNSFITKVKNGELAEALAMPILTDARQGIRMLLNQPADLITYALPPLGVSFEYLQVFPIWGPLAVSIEISFGFTVDLHGVGFDTFGYKRYADGGYRNPELIFDGFFFSDGDLVTKEDLPDFTFEFGLVGAAELNLGIARAGVGGGIDATIVFDWHDSIPDGNVHFSEIIGNAIENPLAIFDVSGALTFQMFAFLEISLLGIDEKFPITPETELFSFNETFTRDPVLATKVGDTLYLNMGPNAQDRLNRNTSDGNEEMALVHEGGGTVKVSSTKLGVSGQQYTGIKHIVGLGGEGNDTITLTGFDGSGITGDFDGGVGDDTITYISAADGLASVAGARIVGGLGNDTLWGGDGNDTIIGGEGNDEIKGQGGFDILFGDQGRVADTVVPKFISARITDSDGADTIDGGAADDVVIGAGGSDKLNGGEGTDLILGDGGRFEYSLVNGHVDIAALRPADYVIEPPGDYKNPELISKQIDAIQDAVLAKIRATELGLGGNDVIRGDGGNDLVLGGTGDDDVEGNGGNDLLLGGKGFDYLRGGADNDTLFGGDQADVLDGDGGNDVMSGDAGNDFMHGNAGDDVMKGGTGGDVMFGDAGNDQVFGQTEPDVLFGGLDDDLVVGGTSNDIMFGDDGLVAKLDPTTGSGVKVIGIGFAGIVPAGQYFDADVRTLDLILTDVVNGDGDDRMSGDAGDDLMLGGGGNDLMAGDVDPRLTTAGVDTSISEDVLIGDGGRIVFDQRRFKSIETVIGIDSTGTPFNDVIFGDNGNDYILGGRGSDVLFGGHGKNVIDVTAQTLGTFRGATDLGAADNDIVVGDNGILLFAAKTSVNANTTKTNFGKLEVVHTTDTSNDTGGHEYAEGELGNDVIFGGVNGSVDVLFGNEGDDVLLGDNGELDFDFEDGAHDLGTLDLITSYRDGLGGTDIVSGSAGDDVLIGGTGGDTMYGDDAGASNGAADGEDIMLGDNGKLLLIGTTGRLTVKVATMTVGTAVDLIRTIDDVDSGNPAFDTASEVNEVGGADAMSGNAMADIVIGGVNGSDPNGIDRLYGDRAVPTDASIGLDGDDILVGDNALLDFTYLSDTDRLTLDLIRSLEKDGLGGIDELSGNRGADVGIGGNAADTIYGDDALYTAEGADLSDMLLGDNADIFLVALGGASGPDLKTVLGAAVTKIRTTDEDHPEYGGRDTISGNAGGDLIAGGVQGDTLYGDRATATPTSAGLDGNDLMLGDNGAFEWQSGGRLNEVLGIDVQANNPALAAWFAGGPDIDLGTLDLVTTEQATSGGRDTMYGDEGSDLMFGGTDADLMHGDDGNGVALTAKLNADLMLGDHGRLYRQFSRASLGAELFASPVIAARNFFAIDTGAVHGGQGDWMVGEEGPDIMLGQQGDDRMWGGSGDDDMTGGHNVAGGVDEFAGSIAATLQAPDNAMNDLMDGGTGDDAMAGDNAIVWRRLDDLSPRFRLLTDPAIYATSADTITLNIGSAMQSDPANSVGRDIELLDHSDGVQADPQGRFGQDVMAGGADNDVMFGQLGDDLMQGDGAIELDATDASWISRSIVVVDGGELAPDLDTGDIYHFNIPEATTDGDDYMEGNGGSDLMYGGLGQDDMLGGSSALFGLDAADPFAANALRPDASDTMFGGAGVDVGRNALGDATTDTSNSVVVNATGHARDADFMMGDNANVYRLVKADDLFETFFYDNYAGGLRIVPRGMQQLDYTLGGGDYAGGGYNGLDQATPPGAPVDNGAADLIHGEAGDDIIFGMTGSDVLFGEGQDDDLIGGYGHDWISGGTGQDGVLGDDGLVRTSRNSVTGEPLHGVAGLLLKDGDTRYANGNALDEAIATPGGIQTALINKSGELKKTADLVPFSHDPAWIADDDEFPDNMGDIPFADDIIFGGLGSDWLHGGSGDDAISGAEALPSAFVPTNYGIVDGEVVSNGRIDLGYDAVGIPNALVVNPTQQNPGNVLAFNKDDLDGEHLNNRFRAGEFELYDEYSPRQKILLDADGRASATADDDTPGIGQFLLNFDKTEGVIRPAGTVPKATGQQTDSYPQVNDDGDDAIFGDLGNDWLVGGTGRDNVYGGWGNDLLQVDDNLDTDSVDTGPQDDVDSPNDNEAPDTHPTYEDRAYGGAGRDVLIGNTGGDRLIDWVGEYNSYLVPYAPFGQASVSRTLQPFLPEFLYALSAGDGADPTRYADAFGSVPPMPTSNNPIPSRNGEPHGELGLVLQKDFAWGDQTGAPADPQAGNIPGGPRDVLRSADFAGNDTQGFVPESGTWKVANNAYEVAPAASGGKDAISLFYADSVVPNYFEIRATINALKPLAGFKANAYIVFDYQSPTDFKFAGINISTNKVEIGQRASWGFQVLASKNMALKAGQDYNVLLAINGTAVTLVVNGAVSVTYAFAPRTDADGFQYNINAGMFGLGADNAKARIDNVILQRLPPTIRYAATDAFDPTPTLLTASSGVWMTGGGRFGAMPSALEPVATAINAIAVRANSLLQLETVVSVSAPGGSAGLVFDRYSDTDFKWAGISLATKQVLVGHYTAKSGWVVDQAVSRPDLAVGVDYTLGLTLKGSTASVTLNGSAALSRVYNAVVVDGAVGLFARGGLASFDRFVLKTDDAAYAAAMAASTATATTASSTTASASGPTERLAFAATPVPAGTTAPEWTQSAPSAEQTETVRLRSVLTGNRPSTEEEAGLFASSWRGSHAGPVTAAASEPKLSVATVGLSDVTADLARLHAAVAPAAAIPIDWAAATPAADRLRADPVMAPRDRWQLEFLTALEVGQGLSRANRSMSLLV